MTPPHPTEPADATAHSPAWSRRNLLSLGELDAAEIRHLLHTARGFQDISTRSVKKAPALRGRVVVNLFFEDSTRTRASFELAASRLSADVLSLTGSGSSVSKGETLEDTARTIEAMGVDALVVRHGRSGAAELLADRVGCAVINAGDGRHEHPTQGLLDLYAIAHATDRFDTLDFTDLTVAIVGDIAHSRVARSDIHGLRKLGARVLLVAPPTLLPKGLAELGCELVTDLDAALAQADVVNMLRVQFERLSGPQFPGQREYHALFGLTRERLERSGRSPWVMHPGPVNRGLEIDAEIADSPRSLILQQVGYGLAVRMAVLYLLLAGRKPHPARHPEPAGL
ncbi:MAG: aspartate carbamoyltransferase catalytic subunit [Planctomycetota bacterium]